MIEKSQNPGWMKKNARKHVFRWMMAAQQKVVKMDGDIVNSERRCETKDNSSVSTAVGNCGHTKPALTRRLSLLLVPSSVSPVKASAFARLRNRSSCNGFDCSSH